MKIVKFKDGTFGVRRWHWHWGYQLLGKPLTYSHKPYWFTFDHPESTHMTIEQARKGYQNAKAPSRDYGTPIPKEDYSL